MVNMGPEVTVELGPGYGNIDKVRVSEGYGIQYSEDAVKRRSKTGIQPGSHVSEVRYQTDSKPGTPVFEQLPRAGAETPISPGSAHVSELHYRHGAVSPSIHKTELAYNVGKFDENQNVFMNISSAPSPTPLQQQQQQQQQRPHSGSWGHEPFWAAPHDADKAKQLERDAKLKTPPPGPRIPSPMDSKLVQMAEPARPKPRGGRVGYGEDFGYSSDFDEYRRQEALEKKASLLSRRGYNGDLGFDFDADPLLSTRVIKRRKKKNLDDEAPKRLSDPAAYREWEDEIARKLDELGQRAEEDSEREKRRTRAEKLSHDTERMLELMGDDIGGKVKTLRSRTDELLTQRQDDDLRVDLAAHVEDDDRTDAENINKASRTVMKELREYRPD